MDRLIQLKKLFVINSVPCSKTEKVVQDFGRENLKEETTWKVGGCAFEENDVITRTGAILFSVGCNKHMAIRNV